MSDIISKWLTETLGIIVEVRSQTFVRLIQNGYLVAAILRHYNVITSDQLTSLTSSGDSANNLSKIVVWLKEINVDLNNDGIKALEKGKISAALELFYKLYLIFQGKEPLYFTTKQIQTEKLRGVNDKFAVISIGDNVPDSSDIPPHPLSEALDDYNHIIQWHKDRYQQLLQRCEEAKANYAAFMERKVEVENDVKFKAFLNKEVSSQIHLRTHDEKSLNESYEELLKQEKKFHGFEQLKPDSKMAKEMVKNIKKKFDKERIEDAFQTKMETIVTTQFWNDMLNIQGKRIECDISQKMLKQSYYEKQMTNKMFEIREQKNIMTENRLAVLNEIQKKKDDELLQRAFTNEGISANERCRYYFERDRALELHRKIYEEKQRLKTQRKCDICQHILEDMIDIALSRSDYKRAFNEEMPRRMLTDLAALFISSQPILDLVPNQEVIIEYDPEIENMEEIYLEEINRQNAIDKRNFENYCNYEWPWELEVHLPDYIETQTLYEIQMAMNILGHIFFRLLLAKYPKPALKPPPKIPKVHIAVCITNISDSTVLPTLSKLLSEKQVKIIQMEDVINYCLSVYKEEITVEYPESQFLDETQEDLKKLSEKKKPSKDGKKDKQDLKKKGEKKNNKNKPINDTDSLTITPVQEKQVQTPKLFPCEEPVLTPTADLGRLAYEILNLGEGINDRLLVQMFVEYLKTLTNIDGWVLINYPTTFEQMCLLEEALTSKPVPINIGVIKEEAKPLGKEVVPPLNDNNDCNAFASKDLNVSSESFGLGALFSSGVLSNNGNSLKVKDETEEERNTVESKKRIINDAIEDIADLDFREVKENNEDIDKNAQFRVSKLLCNPDSLAQIDNYDTYLTAFIRIIQNRPNETDLETSIVADDKLDNLDKFYQEQGCLYNLYYKVLDLATIKHIGKLIIGDYSIPPKTSVEIFGDTVLYLENDFDQSEPTPGKVSKSKFGGEKEKKTEKPASPKTQKDEPKDKKEKKTKKGKGDDSTSNKSEKKGKKSDRGGGDEPDIIIEKVDKETQIPEIPLGIEEIYESPIPEPTPGQFDWKYSDLPIPNFFQIALATLWENVEEIYVCDFKELFFRRRILWKAVMPYLDFVKRYMRDYIGRPDNKQIHLFNFQRMYNEIAADMRDDDEVKAELLCRIYEFREKMWQICDTRMQEAEQERQNIITQDWMTKQACELTNIYITAMQLEIDRCADTFQFLNDYYVAMITKMPSQEEVLEKVILDYIILKDDFQFEGYSYYSQFVRDNLIDTRKVLSTSPYHELINKNCIQGINTAKNYQSKSLMILSTMEVYFQPKGSKGKPKKDVKSKGKLKLPKFSAPDPEVKQVGLKLIDEWQCAIKGEFARVCLRLNLLKSVSHDDLKDILSSSTRTFHGLFDEIKQNYDKEITSVRACCDVLTRAVEEEMAIQPELVLEDGTFYIDPNALLFEDPLPEPEPEIKEREKPEIFTINQLSYLTDVLFNLAPSGIIPERAFTFLLQDMIVNNAEDGQWPLVPSVWQQLELKNINRLSYEFFGHVELVEWKDFVIYNLCVDFPNELELMQTRNQFREFDVDSNEYVYDYQFKTVKFWFENQFNGEDPYELRRLREMKDLLFKLYRISEDTVNYTALLLAFCKDVEAHLGLAKALQLSLGKLVCWDSEIGENFVKILRQRRLEQLQEKLRAEQEQARKFDAVNEIVDDLIDITVHQCDSCYLESYDTNLTNSKDSVMDQELIYLENLMHDYEMQYEYNECEENISQHFLQEQFSNAEIGYEPESHPMKAYYLPFDLLITVMMAAMPWQAVSKNPNELGFRQKLEDIYKNCENQEFEDVFMHEFLNSQSLKEFLANNFKFVIKKPTEIINKLLEDK